MLYLNHDFYSNFDSGIQSGDNNLITDILINELSELIVYNEDKIFDLFNRVGIKISEKSSDEKIVDTILNNIETNVKLSKGLAFLIAQNNDASKNGKQIKGKNGKERRAKRNKAATISEIDKISSGIIGIGDSFKYKPQLKKEFKLKMMQVIKTKSEAVGDRARKLTNNNNGKYVLLTFLVIGAGIGIYFYLKHRKKIAAEGMEIKGSEPSKIETPPVTPISVPEPIQQPATSENITQVTPTDVGNPNPTTVIEPTPQPTVITT